MVVRAIENFNDQNMKSNYEHFNGTETSTTSYDPKPIFGSKNELYVPSGSNINIYHASEGKIIGILKGHDHKVICISKLKKPEEIIVSCDEQANILSWKLKTHKLVDRVSIPMENGSVVSHFSLWFDSFLLTTTKSGGKGVNLRLLTQPFAGNDPYIATEINPGQNQVSISYDGKYAAAIKYQELFVSELISHNNENYEYRFHKTGKNNRLTCLAFHPTKHVLATGNESGRIILWYQILEVFPIKVILHWHTLPVNDICFSSTGSDLFSGGDECVLVRWHLNDDNQKSFMPRLGMPISSIQRDDTDSLLAIQHIDKSISVVNSKEMQLEGLIQRMTSHVPLFPDSLLSTGLQFHPPTSSLIKNGRTGHLQFFHPFSLKMNYNLDITMCNFVTEERNRVLPNVEVMKSAVSCDGLWLITIEVCQLRPSFKEIVMKFWNYSLKQQRWELNTSIQTPHTDTVTSLAVKPQQSPNDQQTCVSCSDDGTFKIWKLITYQDVLGKERNHWNSRSTRDFRGLPATACAFSSDASLLAVGFESLVTLWTPEDVALVGVLSQSTISGRILDVTFSFGPSSGSSLVTRFAGCVCSWNLFTRSLRWKVFLESTCLAVDPSSGLIAIFSARDVFFVDPSSIKPVGVQENVSSSDVLCALFIQSNRPADLKNARTRNLLFFFNKSQEFLRLDNPYSTEGEDGKVVKKKPSAKTLPREKKGRKGKKDKEGGGMFAAMVGKTRTLTTTKTEEEPEAPEVNLVLPSINNLLKDMKDLHTHTISFEGFADHIESFLPNLSSSTKKEKTINYTTVEEGRRKHKSLISSSVMEDKMTVEAVQKMDYQTLLKQL